ncbi:hypothetical protein [Glycocaulis sp.]|uniref:hypothetical protein n=1 Tax=Glycocaulis sp. TaxID=1969725 RepID=UPI003D221CC1
MKTFLISGVSALALAGMALAVPFEEADTDGDGRVSLEELQAIDPATTEAEFTLYDVDLDGGLDEDEYAAWRVATQGDAQPDPFSDPMTDDPLQDDPMADEDPVDLEEVPADPYGPSLNKSLDEHDDKDEYGDEERDEHADDAYSVPDAAFDRDDVDYDRDADEDDITDELNEEQADALEEDGDESDPWK